MTPQFIELTGLQYNEKSSVIHLSSIERIEPLDFNYPSHMDRRDIEDVKRILEALGRDLSEYHTLLTYKELGNRGVSTRTVPLKIDYDHLVEHILGQNDYNSLVIYANEE